MARGWESKSVESQMEDAMMRRARSQTAAPAPEELQKRAKLRSLELNLARVQGELKQCRNARFRALLEAELKHLEAEIRKHRG